MKNTFKNMTAAILLFTLTFFAADYSYAKTSKKKTAIHKSTKKAHGKKKNSASHKSAKKKKVASVSKKKKNRQVASTDGGNWAHTGVKKASKAKRSKVGSKYNNN
ncbi:MAG: hypothetical protein H7256_05935 [Bdellovibrio sp.]|nr:hypothetical protein [Bdellovibrio sp.]